LVPSQWFLALIESRGLPRAWLSSTMTLGQMAEIVMLAVFPRLLRRLGVRLTMALLIAAWFPLVMFWCSLSLA